MIFIFVDDHHRNVLASFKIKDILLSQTLDSFCNPLFGIALLLNLLLVTCLTSFPLFSLSMFGKNFIAVSMSTIVFQCFVLVVSKQKWSLYLIRLFFIRIDLVIILRNYNLKRSGNIDNCVNYFGAPCELTVLHDSGISWWFSNNSLQNFKYT